MSVFLQGRQEKRKNKKTEKDWIMEDRRSTERKKWKRIVFLTIGIVVVALFVQAGILMYVNSKNANKTSQMLLDQAIGIIERNRELNQSEVSDIVRNMPMSQGMSIYVADRTTHEILGATDESKIGKKLEGVGIPRMFLKGEEEQVSGLTKIRGEKYNCVFEVSGDYLIGVTFAISVDNQSNLIAILVVAVYLIIACSILLMLVARVLRANREKREQVGILASMAGIYHSMYMINLETDSMIAYSDQGVAQATGKERGNADQMMHDLMSNHVMEAYRDQADRFADLHTVADRMKGKKLITGEFVSKELGWFRASFITIEADINDKPVKTIFTVQVIESEKQKEETLIETSNTDELTGCLNRRAYEKDIRGLFPSTEFVYVSMDVNGLKIVNDSLGHAAGDELLCGASYCIRKSFENYGKVYRIGGDEFAAIVFTNMEQFSEIRSTFERTVETWSGEQVDSISISYGVVSSREKMWESVSEIAHAADIRMYEKKALYYSRHGVDRRGQPAAYIALCKLFPKVLKIDLNEDAYRVLSWEEQPTGKTKKEKAPNVTEMEKPEEGKYSEWVETFAETEQITEEDREEYRAKMDVETLKKYFDAGNMVQTVTCQMKRNGAVKNITMEIVPTDDYGPESRTGFLYIKEY